MCALIVFCVNSNIKHFLLVRMAWTSLYIPKWAQTHGNPLASASQMLKLQSGITMPGFKFFPKQNLNFIDRVTARYLQILTLVNNLYELLKTSNLSKFHIFSRF